MNDYFQNIFVIMRFNIQINHNAEDIPNFIGNIFQEFLCVLYSADGTIVLNAKINFAALRIGKAANPLEIFRTPVIRNISQFDHFFKPEKL